MVNASLASAGKGVWLPLEQLAARLERGLAGMNYHTFRSPEFNYLNFSLSAEGNYL